MAYLLPEAMNGWRTDGTVHLRLTDHLRPREPATLWAFNWASTMPTARLSACVHLSSVLYG